MYRSSLFVRGFLAGAGLVIAGMAGVAAMAWGTRATRAAQRRLPAAPDYAYLR